jgi:hypothetical protein
MANVDPPSALEGVPPDSPTQISRICPGVTTIVPLTNAPTPPVLPPRAPATLNCTDVTQLGTVQVCLLWPAAVKVTVVVPGVAADEDGRTNPAMATSGAPTSNVEPIARASISRIRIITIARP